MTDQHTPSPTGDDGELLVEDKTVDPRKNLPYIKPNPISVELRDHLEEWGCVYVCVVPIVLLVLIASLANDQSPASFIIGLITIPLVIIAVVFAYNNRGNS